MKNCIDALASTGKYFFTDEELLKTANISIVALSSSLRRLKKKGEIASPLRGFYLIVPPEFRSLGSLPPEQFIDDLMRHLQLPYYIGLLSAAQCYGAPGQSQQTLQVVTPRPRRMIQLGNVKIIFITKVDAAKSATRQFSTPRGLVNVASPETVAVDLVSFPQHTGGLKEVFEIFSEISHHLKIKELSKAIQRIKLAPLLQRMGYFFECLELQGHAEACEAELKKYRYVRKTLLDPQGEEGGELNEKWNLILNNSVTVYN